MHVAELHILAANGVKRRARGGTQYKKNIVMAIMLIDDHRAGIETQSAQAPRDAFAVRMVEATKQVERVETVGSDAGRFAQCNNTERTLGRSRLTGFAGGGRVGLSPHVVLDSD